MKKRLILVILVILLVIPHYVYASSRQVTVTIPEFSATLNYREYSYWDLDYMRWPLLVYNDITYFPMTYYKSNLLNLITSWTAEGGLVISKGDPTTPKASFLDERVATPNRRTQTATIVTSKVTVNGTVIDNQNEPYPLLLFRGITYFPLTWRFAVEEFGWSYYFSNEEGLNITANNFFFSHRSTFETHFLGHGETVFIDNELRISLLASSTRSGPAINNLLIIRDGVEIRPNGYFGLFQEFGPHFTVHGNYVHTTFFAELNEAENRRPVRVNINTGAVHIIP